MSLINDALRRANQEKKEQPPAASGGAPMQPVPPSRENAGKSSFSPLWLVWISILLLIAGWQFWKGMQRGRALAQTETTNPSASPEIVAPPASIQQISPPPGINSPETLTDAPTLPAVTSAPATITNPPPTVAPPAPPPLKLQGIFYRISRPTALINGKTVAAGDTVSGARVLKIERQSVTLERDGQSLVLTME